MDKKETKKGEPPAPRPPQPTSRISSEKSKTPLTTHTNKNTNNNNDEDNNNNEKTFHTQSIARNSTKAINKSNNDICRQAAHKMKRKKQKKFQVSLN